MEVVVLPTQSTMGVCGVVGRFPEEYGVTGCIITGKGNYGGPWTNVWVKFSAPRRDVNGDGPYTADQVDARLLRVLHKVGAVETDMLCISCLLANGSRREISISDLITVELETSDEGPFIEDVFWILRTAEEEFHIPQLANGTAYLLERLQSLPGFDNQAVIDAMSSMANKRYLLWLQAVPTP